MACATFEQKVLKPGYSSLRPPLPIVRTETKPALQGEAGPAACIWWRAGAAEGRRSAEGRWNPADVELEAPEGICHLACSAWQNNRRWVQGYSGRYAYVPVPPDRFRIRLAAKQGVHPFSPTPIHFTSWPFVSKPRTQLSIAVMPWTSAMSCISLKVLSEE